MVELKNDELTVKVEDVSGEVLEIHHFAVLLGFGATAINPWLALATVAEIGHDGASPLPSIGKKKDGHSCEHDDHLLFLSS